MRATALTISLLLGLVSADSIPNFDKPKEIKRNRFGASEVIDYSENGFTKTVIMPSKSYLRDYA